MAERVAETIGDRDITHLRVSPLERVRETAAPLAAARGLEPVVDERVIESTNVFEGKRFGKGNNTLSSPSSWLHLWNPFRPSWGEPYTAGRRRGCAPPSRTPARRPPGHEAVVVSHQLPIWVARLSAEGRPFLHDPRKRQCTLCSLDVPPLRGRAAGPGVLLRARRRHDPAGRQARDVLGGRRARGEQALIRTPLLLLVCLSARADRLHEPSGDR